MKKVLLVVLITVIFIGVFISCKPVDISPEADNSKNNLAESWKSDELLLFSPAKIGDPADNIDESVLVALLENTLYANGMIIVGWITSGTGLDLDNNSVYETENAVLEYVLVKNIQNMAALKTNCEAVFSKTFLSSHVYSFLTEGNLPLFVENDGKLYYNKNTGGGVGFAPDFSRATVTGKNADSFEIQVPMCTYDDPDGELFTFKAIQQNGNWVLNSCYYFQQ